MEVGFKYNEPRKDNPVYIEQVFAEKPGGGIVANPSFDVPPTTAVGEVDGKLKVIKAYRVVETIGSSDTSFKIAKGSGIERGDIIGVGSKGVASTKVDTTTSEDYDVVTATLGVAVAAGTVLYQALSAGDSAKPIATPKYVTGNWIYANEGDQRVRLINGANLRKETANIANEVAVLLPTIQLV